MTDESAPSPTRPLAGRGECQQALRDALALAAKEGCRELWCCDADYADWPLGERAVVEHLTAWAASHRKLVLLGRSFDELPRRHARFVEWRRAWSHVADCRRLHDDDAPAAPSLLLAPGLVSLRIVDPVHHRGTWSTAAADMLRQRELVDALSQRSTESFPVTTLGL